MTFVAEERFAIGDEVLQVANLRPISADSGLAERLGVPRGELLVYIWQVDYTSNGTPVLLSHEYHLADAFDFSVIRRGPERTLT